MTLRLLLMPVLVAAACGGPTAHPAGADAPRASDALAGGDAPGGGDASPALDPANDGAYAVTVTDVTIPAGGTRQAAATTFVPTGAPAPRPLVFVSPGFQMARSQYTSYAHHLATWGMTVVLADYTDTGFFPDHQQLADDISTEITWALGQQDLAIDATKIATAGHSLGGKLSVLVAADDDRIRAVVGWDPVDGGTPTVVPDKMATVHAAIAVVGETTDGSGGGMPCAPTNENYETFYGAAPSPALAMTIANASHMDWVDDPSCALCGFCTAGTAPRELVRTASRRLDVAWLRAQLLGDTAMAPWLASPPEVTAGEATVEQK